MTDYTNDKPFRTTTRSIRTAEAIRDGVSFDTSGALMGRTRTPRPGSLGGPWGYGRLSGADLDAARHDDTAGEVDYVVWSYSTPIAWRLTDGSWYLVGQSFSPTTAKHKGNLYLIPRDEHEVSLVKSGSTDPDDRWQVVCHTCSRTVGSARYKADTYSVQHNHRVNGRTLAGAR